MCLTRVLYLLLKSYFNFLYRLLSIVGSRTVQHGKNYNFILNAADYHDNEEVEISMVGENDGNDIFSETYKLNHVNQNISIEVSLISVKRKLKLFCR